VYVYVCAFGGGGIKALVCVRVMSLRVCGYVGLCVMYIDPLLTFIGLFLMHVGLFCRSLLTYLAVVCV